MKSSVLALFAATALLLSPMSLVQAQDTGATTEGDPAVECPVLGADAVTDAESATSEATDDDDSDVAPAGETTASTGTDDQAVDPMGLDCPPVED